MAGGIAVHQHFDFPLFGPDDHALVPHAAHHIKGIYRASPKGQFQDIFRNALLQCLFQVVGDFEKPIGGAQAADPLVRPFVIVIGNPKSSPLHRLIKAVKLGPLKEFILNRLPESLNFAQCHRVVGA